MSVWKRLMEMAVRIRTTNDSAIHTIANSRNSLHQYTLQLSHDDHMTVTRQIP